MMTESVRLEREVPEYRSPPLQDNPYWILHALHTVDTGEPFTNVIDRGSAFIAGLSTDTDTPLSNNVLADHPPADRDRLQLEGSYLDMDRTPAFYVPLEARTRALRQYLTAHNYRPDPNWRDAWLKAGAEIIAKPEVLETTAEPVWAEEIGTDELDTFLTIGNWARRGDKWMENAYSDPLDQAFAQEDRARLRALGRLILSGRGHCFILYKEYRIGTRTVATPVSTAAVATRGIVAYISNVSTVPHESGNGYARTVMAAAIRASSDVCRFASSLGTEPVICLATTPGQKSYDTFTNMGFEPGFEAQGYLLAA
jgi:hypothetical protein